MAASMQCALFVISLYLIRAFSSQLNVHRRNSSADDDCCSLLNRIPDHKSYRIPDMKNFTQHEVLRGKYLWGGTEMKNRKQNDDWDSVCSS